MSTPKNLIARVARYQLCIQLFPPRPGETDHARCVSGVEDRTGADVTMEILGGLGKQISVGKLQVVER